MSQKSDLSGCPAQPIVPAQAGSAGAEPATSIYSISGKVTSNGTTGIGNITVTAYIPATSSEVSTSTVANGTYTVTVPIAGDYVVAFDDPAQNYLSGYYDSGAGTGFTFDYNLATPVTVAGPVININAQPGTGHYIRGTVTGPGGSLMQGVYVLAMSGSYNGHTNTNINGSYAVMVPDSDSYTIRFDATGYLNGYYYAAGGSDHFTQDYSFATGVPSGTTGATGIDVRLTVAPPWAVTLTADSTIGAPGSTLTLTATTNQNVGPTPYFIVIVDSNGIVQRVCGGGTACSVGLTDPVPTTWTYHAVIGNGSGTDVQATSNSITLKWTTEVASSTFHPLTPPVRILDTRFGNGLGGKLLANTPATFSVAGRAGSGIPPNANAVTGNVTVVNQSASWGIYLGPNPLAYPGSSSLNFDAGQITGNGLTVALSATGTLSATYMANPGNTTDLVLDLTGYFTPDTSGATYHAITPIRMLDTRSGNGLSGRLTSNTSATFSIAGRPGSGIPPNAVAITGNLTVVNPTNSWVVYLGPVATDTPGTSNINFLRGEIKGNSLTVALASDGSLSTTYVSSGGNTTDLVLDVTGYYTPDASGASFVPINPTRLLDTRVANGLPGKLTSNTAATFAVGGRGVIPLTAAAVTGNVTVVNETDSWAIYIGPDPLASPGTSNLNFLRGDIRGNGVTVALGSGGTLSTTFISHPGQTTDLVLDVTGYFVP